MRTKEADVVIVGAGIQGLILARELQKQGLRIVCVTNENIVDSQTLRSQFYLHRGHFYTEAGLATTLNQTYAKWTALIQEMNLPTTINQSYIGFDCPDDEKRWLDVWKKASLPFEKTKALPDILKTSQGESFYQFPHVLFSGQTLIEKLNKRLSDFLIAGNITKIVKCGDGGHNVSITCPHQEERIRAKHIVLCAGSGNGALIDLIGASSKNVPKVQKRACQVLVLNGNLPNMSILMPGLKMFIAPQYSGKEVRWLYTFGTDPLIGDEPQTCDLRRLNQQVKTLLKFFPALRALRPKYGLYHATKIESADLGRGKRPNESCVHRVTDGTLAVWPTKLTLAFDAAEKVCGHVRNPPVTLRNTAITTTTTGAYHYH